MLFSVLKCRVFMISETFYFFRKFVIPYNSTRHLVSLYPHYCEQGLFLCEQQLKSKEMLRNVNLTRLRKTGNTARHIAKNLIAPV